MIRIVSAGANGVLNLRGVRILPGPHEHAEPRTQLRWMTNPAHGLPGVFTVWRRPFTVGDKRAAAAMTGWQPIEIVGLPVETDWPGYPAIKQGPVVPGTTDGQLGALEACELRLKNNAPTAGWDSGVETWEPPSLSDYLKQVTEGPILAGLRSMLEAGTPPSEHVNYPVENTDNSAGRLLPKLILGDVAADTQETASSTFHPYRLMCLSASADPLAALAFGFGTGLVDDGEATYMVTFTIKSADGDVEFADIVHPQSLQHPLDPPAGLFTTLSAHTRPQRTDGAALDSIAVGWSRVVPPTSDPNVIASEAQTLPTSYAIGRAGTGMLQPRMMLTPRPAEVGGWLPYVPATNDSDPTVRFQDHVVRELSIGGMPPKPYPGAMAFRYFIAAQDLYGRWSQWRQVDHAIPAESLRAPQITGMRLVGRDIPPGQEPPRVIGTLEVDFAWDWSDRSPEIIELHVNWEGEASFRTVVLQFDGEDTPSPDPTIVPLSPSLAVTGTFGTAQDNPTSGPGTRHYRWRVAFDDLFPGGEASRIVQARARASMHIYAGQGTPAPFGNFAPVHELELLNPLPPPGPAIVPTEAPLWASLPDTLGISRFDLEWPAVSSAIGYHIYEATETALLSALQLDGPDLTQPFTKRLRDLRQASLRLQRHAFRRITDGPLPATRHEVSLPRGSRVIHLFTVLAQNGNGANSDWPTNSGAFIAVAAPRQVLPSAPALFAAPSAAGATIEVQFAPYGGGDTRIYRTQSPVAARSIDSMGPAHKTLPFGGGASVTFDDAVPPSWAPYLYRAQVWSRDNLTEGLLEARSPTSPLVTVFVPPAEIGLPTALVANLALSTPTASLIAWQSDVPLVDTPLGTFEMIVEVRDQPDGPVQKRLAANPATLPAYADTGLAPGPGAELVAFRVTSGARFCAWMPRPANASRHVTVKVIDPRGPLKTASIDVPPLAVQTVTIPPWKTQREVEEGDDMGVFYQGAADLGLGVNYYYEQQLPGHFDGEVISTTPPTGTVVPVGTVILVVVNIGNG